MATMTLADRVTAAEDALQKLMTGSMREEVRYQNGDMVRFTPADVQKLRSYIEDLKNELCGGKPRGAIGVRF